MNGLEILNYISKDEFLLSRFGGLFAIDQLTFTLPNREIFYICNTDVATQKGKHWVVIYFPEKSSTVEFFDSLGKKPNKNFQLFMAQRQKAISFNSRRVQGASSKACGYYCLYFIYLRSRYIDYKGIIENFSNSTEKNEKHVIDFVTHSLS